MSKKKINGYTIDLNKQIGRGSFGVVYQAYQDGTKIKCAVKMLDKMHIEVDQYVHAAIFRQIQILKNLRNQNIVAFFDVMESQRYYYIVQQMCDTDLEHVIKQEKKLSEKQAVNYLTQICNGFTCLIQEGIVHRDLKPANIMLHNNQIKLGDFGLAKRCRNKRLKIGSSVGSPLYMSLQLLKQQPYSSKCDIWAIGCVFYQMLHGRPPWYAKTQYNLVSQIESKDPEIDSDLNKKTKDFIKKCLQKQQSKRMSWEQLFAHPIFEGNFKKFTRKNEQCQNKLKMIMADIRFKINAQNLNLKDLFDQMGFNTKKQLAFKNFDEFIRIVNPSINSQQVVYFFEKLDINDDGKISLQELQNQMQNNHITIGNDPKPAKQMATSTYEDQSFCSSHNIKHNRLGQNLQFKIKKCFIKLYKILNDRKLTLYKTFKAYDQGKKNYLSKPELQKILGKLDQSLTPEEKSQLFAFIDKDRSDSIQFDELNAYYCRVNGVNQTMDLPPQHYYAKGKINYRNNMPEDRTQILKKFFKNIN